MPVPFIFIQLNYLQGLIIINIDATDIFSNYPLPEDDHVL